MKKSSLLFTALLMTLCAIGQDNLVFKSLGLDTSSALIAVCPFYDKDKVYKAFAFYVDKKEDLKKIAQTLSYGNKVKADTLDDDLNIFIIKDKEVLPIQIGTSPKYGYLNIEDNYYNFDASQIQTIAKNYPLNYIAKTMKFKKEEDFNAFIKKYKNDPSFLCFEDITEELEGMFTVEMKITNRDKPASYGWEIIENDLKKIGAKKDADYIISYTPRFDNSNIYHYEIRISKKVYDKLNSSSYTKGKWTMNLKEIITYWKK